MLKIGELAKLCNVSTQTLRFYDSEGLLKPEVTNQSSGYRYYGAQQIEILKEILHLKELNFELSEIKAILCATGEEKNALYEKKIRSLKKDAICKRVTAAVLEALHQGIEHDTSKMSLWAQMQSLPFENDERAVGKWIYKGRCRTLSRNTQKLLSPENLDRSFAPETETLFFLPGGAFYWGFGWTKGILYTLSEQTNILLIPNAYEIIEAAEKRYMLIHWIADACSNNTATSYELIYEQLDNLPHTDRDTRVCRDDVDIPYSADPDFIGTWRSVAFLRNIEEFDPNAMPQRDDLFITKIKAYVRGACTKELRGRSRVVERTLMYSKGVILDRGEETAEHYTIKKMRAGETERTYLFLEHKTGDYVYNGKIHYYFVFEKEEV